MKTSREIDFIPHPQLSITVIDRRRELGAQRQAQLELIQATERERTDASMLLPSVNDIHSGIKPGSVAPNRQK